MQEMNVGMEEEKRCDRQRQEMCKSIKAIIIIMAIM